MGGKATRIAIPTMRLHIVVIGIHGGYEMVVQTVLRYKVSSISFYRERRCIDVVFSLRPLILSFCVTGLVASRISRIVVA